MEDPTPPPIAPETISQKKPAWSKTLGIIAVIFGALGTCQAAIAPVALIFTKNQMQSYLSEKNDQNTIDGYVEKLTALSIQSGIISTVLGIALLVGGIMLLKRKPTASPVLKIWSVAKIIAGCYLTFANMSVSKLQMSIMTNSDVLGNEAEMITQFTSIGVIVGAVFGLLWLAALPVFLLIWLNRARIREDIRSW